MKKTLYFIAAMTVAASTAMASKARVTALSNSQAITDVQYIFLNPANMHYVGDFVTFEMGEKSATAGSAVDGTPNAEGGFINTLGEGKFGVYLGRMAADTNGFRAYGNATAVGNFLQQENSTEIFYGAKAGDLNWGASFSFSNSARKNTAVTTDDQTQSAMGVRMGVRTDEWAGFANIGLGSTAKEGEASVKATSGLVLGGFKDIDNMRLYAQYEMGGAKGKTAAGADAFDKTKTTTSVGFTNTFKNDGNIAFYGLEYKMISDNNKVGDSKIATSALPFSIGTEVIASSWLKLRGSVSQNILLGTTKTTVAGVGEADSIAQNTVTAAGAGLVWGHNNLDVVLTAGTSGSLDAATFGSNASYTYTF